jgi:hypothetical protein
MPSRAVCCHSLTSADFCNLRWWGTPETLMRKITVRLTDESLAGWNKVALGAGVSLTAFIEAIGLDMNERGVIPENRQGHDILNQARQIDQERRNRR